MAHLYRTPSAITRQFESLRKVHICFDSEDLPITDASILALGAQPLLIERGIVFVRGGDIDHLEEDIWAGSR
jgi:hypothetical protein